MGVCLFFMRTLLLEYSIFSFLGREDDCFFFLEKSRKCSVDETLSLIIRESLRELDRLVHRDSIRNRFSLPIEDLRE
jgi:hypothetical protein